MRAKTLCKRMLSATLALLLFTGTELPAVTQPQPLTVSAADEQMNAAAALGLKEEPPEGFDEDNDLKNPYGKKTITFGNADEVLVYHNASERGFWLFGDNISANTKVTLNVNDSNQCKFIKNPNGGSIFDSFSKTVAGNFDGSTDGKKSQYARLTRAYTLTGDSQFSLSVCDARTQESNGSISFSIANDIFSKTYTEMPIGYVASQMSMTVGDFDGNGRDEIAVLTNSRSGLQIDQNYNADPSQYPESKLDTAFDSTGNVFPEVFLEEEDTRFKVIVNEWDMEMIQDTIDYIHDDKVQTPEDLWALFLEKPIYLVLLEEFGITLAKDMIVFAEGKNSNGEMQKGCYRFYKGDTNIGSCVSVYAFTDPDGDYLDMSVWELKRTFAVNACESISLAAGDVNGDGIDDLLVGEGSVNSLANEREASLTVYSGAYSNMLTDATVIDQRFDKYGVTVFTDNSTGKPVSYLAMLVNEGTNGKISVFTFEKGRYREVGSASVPLNVDEKLYANEIYYANGYLCTPLSSTCVKFSPNGLTTSTFTVDAAVTKENYFAFNFQTADLNGDGQQTVFYQTSKSNSYITDVNTHSFGASSNISLNGDRVLHAELFYAIVNTDIDSSSMTYTGRHWFEYTHPRVLAVLASPPYFKDLLEQEDLSGNYPESTTAYGSSKGSGSGTSKSNSFSVGAYVSFEQDISAMGLFDVASFEAEVSTNFSFTDEYEESVEMTYSLEYATSSGADAVVFYSVPFEFYEYEINYYDKTTNQVIPVKQTLCMPKQPCTATIELEKYQSIASNYNELPDLSSMMKHEVGVPSSYPTSTKGYKNVLEFDGNYMAVDFTSASGGITQTQQIEMTEDTCYTSDFGVDVEMKVGAGAGGVTVGVTGGYSHETGKMKTTTEGSAFTASMQNMPKEAEEYGYGMSWKLFSHEGSYKNAEGLTVSFPIVDYLVTDVTQPPSLVTNLRQDYRNSTDSSIVLEWDYDSNGGAEFFNVFRLSNINGKQVRILVAVVPASGGVMNSDGSCTYTLRDDGKSVNDGTSIMSPGVQYEYQIVAARDPSRVPCVSMPSEVLYAYTHAEGVYPDITLTGVTNNKLTMYPDKTYTIGTKVNNAEKFMYIAYQWQKMGKTGWTDMLNANDSTLTIDDPSAYSAGNYRCRVDALAYNEEINSQVGMTVFTDDIDITFKMRSVSQKSFDVSCTDQKPEAVLTLEPSTSVSLHAPTGTVEFHVQGTSFDNTYTVALKADRRTSTAKLSDAEKLSVLPNGIYQIFASYSGDAIYGSFQSETVSVLVGEDAVYPVLFNQDGKRTETFCYGDKLTLKFYQYSTSASGTTSETYLDQLTKNYGISDLLLKDKPGSYKKTINAGGKEYSYSYTLKKRPVEIGISDSVTLYAGDVEGKLPTAVLLSELVPGDTLDQLVTLSYMNAMQSKEIVIDNSTGPGNYYAKLRPNTQNGNKTEYYDLQLYSSTFPINSRLYDLTFTSELLENEEAGAIRMTLPESRNLTNGTLKYESGTLIKLTATPYSGYLLDHWKINNKEYTDNTVSFSMSTQGCNVAVYFKKDTSPVKKGSVIVDETFLYGGSVQYPDDYDSDKQFAIGKEFTFTAKDTEDAVFDYWNEVSGKKTYTIHDREISVTVSETPVYLYPVFKGAPCTVTLGDGILAEYETLNEQEEPVTYTVTSGMTVPKGTTLSLKAVNAASLPHYAWLVNGNQQMENKESITWNVTADTSIALNLFTVQLDGHSLTLDGPVKLNFYVDIKDYDNKTLTAKMFSTHYDSTQQKEVTTALGTFQAQGGAPCAYNSGFDEYRFSVPLAAAMINDKITMEVYLEGNNQPILKNIYSVSEYANSKIASSSNQKLVNTMIALLDYGTQAQKYFDYNNTEANYANKAVTEEQRASARAGITPYATVMEQTNAIDTAAVNNALAASNIALTYTGSTLQLESGVKLRYYFKPTSGTAADALTAYGKVLHFTAPGVTAVTGVKDSEIYIETEQLPAALLTASNSYSLSAGDTVVIGGATISSYYKNIYAKDNSSAKRVQLKSVNEAMYYFAENSKAYFNK